MSRNALQNLVMHKRMKYGKYLFKQEYNLKNECPKIVLESVYTNISAIFHLCKVTDHSVCDCSVHFGHSKHHTNL